MLVEPQPPRIQLLKGWQGCVKSAVLYAISLSHCAIVYARAWATDSINARVRLAVENDRLQRTPPAAPWYSSSWTKGRWWLGPSLVAGVGVGRGMGKVFPWTKPLHRVPLWCR